MQEPSQSPTTRPRGGTRFERTGRLQSRGAVAGGAGHVGAREWALALLAALLVAVLATWPLVGELGRSVPHDPRFTSPEGSDVHLFVWDLWWASEALERGQSPFHTDALFAPLGHSLALHTHVFLWGLLTTPIERLFGAAAAYGALLLALLAASAVACYGLGRHLGLGKAGAAFAALAWALSPYFLQKGLEHLNLTANPLVPLLVWAALVWRDGGQRANWAALATGGLWGSCLLVDTMAALWTALLVLLLWALVPAANLAVGAPQGSAPLPSRRGLFSPVAIALAAVAALSVGGVYLAELRRELDSLARHGRESELAQGTGLARDQLYHPELLDFFTPSGLHPLARTDGAPALGAARPRPDAQYPESPAEHAGLAAPFAALALLAVGAWRVPRSRRWLGLGLCFWLLAWDPGPDPEGWLSGLYRRFFGLDMLRVPARAWPYAWLCLSLVAGAGAAVLAAGGRRGRLALGGAGLLLCFELCALPYPMTPWRVPAAALALAPSDRDDPRAAGGHLLQLPFEPGSSPALSWQTVHERPLVWGYVARTHPEVLERLMRLAPGLFAHALGAPLADPEDLTLELDLLGVEHILVNLHRTQDPERALWVLDRLAGFERRPEGEDARGGPGPDGVLGWSRRRAPLGEPPPPR